jgi:glucokinase
MPETTDAIIGLDLGGTFLKYALGTPEGHLLYKNKTPSQATESREKVFQVIFNVIDELLYRAESLDRHVRAVGIGSPGAVDYEQGKLRGSTPNIVNWADADIRGPIEGRYNLPLWADNDANVMALAEARVGAAKGCKNIIALTLGTGIGGGILIDSQLYRGTFFSGSEIGHMTIRFDGPACNCGNYGCIEAYASAPAIVRNYLQKTSSPPEPSVTTIEIFERAAHGEPKAIETVQETSSYLGVALANIANIFNPEVIVLGGGVADAGDGFLQSIDKEMRRRALPASVQNLRVVRAQLGNDAGVVGAISLAVDALAAREHKDV